MEMIKVATEDVLKILYSHLIAYLNWVLKKSKQWQNTIFSSICKLEVLHTKM